MGRERGTRETRRGDLAIVGRVTGSGHIIGMNPIYYGVWLAGIVFVGMLACLEVGRRVGLRHLARDPEGAKQGIGVVDGAIFALLGLLVAFTFSGAATRFDDRRCLVVEEANDIGTAWLRLQLLEPKATASLQELFREYLDARLSAYRKLPDIEAARGELRRCAALQNRIWAEAVAASERSGRPQAAMLLLPALNQMFDIMTTRTERMRLHPPAIILVMLACLALAAAALAGYDMASGKSRHWAHGVVFAVTLAITIYIIHDLEYPRLGLIRVDDTDTVLVDLRKSMN